MNREQKSCYIHESCSIHQALNEREFRTKTTAAAAAAAAAVTEDRLSRIWLRALNEPESDNDTKCKWSDTFLSSFRPILQKRYYWCNEWILNLICRSCLIRLVRVLVILLFFQVRLVHNQKLIYCIAVYAILPQIKKPHYHPRRFFTKSMKANINVYERKMMFTSTDSRSICTYLTYQVKAAFKNSGKCKTIFRILSRVVNIW